MSASPWTWLESTAIAMRIHDSLLLTASLSALHVVGMTVLAGAVLVSGLRLVGAIFPDRPVLDIVGAARTGIVVGLVTSSVTGALLFAPRAADAVANRIFRVKMLLLAAAALFHVLIYRRAVARPLVSRAALRATGAMSLVLWFAVVAAGCGYILLE